MKIKGDKITLSFGKANILKGIDIDIQNGEFIGVIGPNGSGKTSLLKSLYRLYQKHGGNVYYNDLNTKTLTTKHIAQQMAVVGQHNYYDFDFTVLEIVLMGRSPHKKGTELDNQLDYDIAIESLERVNMLSFSNRFFSTLSGGEQQRVILARALAQQTDAIILDEPTNHLDIKYQIQFLEIVKSLNIEVIGAFHNLNIAAMYCDKIYIMKSGEIYAYGTPKEIITQSIIKAVYEVDIDVTTDPWGNMNIAYKPIAL